MRITSSGITDIGRRRDRNEDTFLIHDELQLFVVADGMGGHAGGEYASSLAVNVVEELVSSVELPHERPDVDGDGDADPVDVLRGLVEEAVQTAGQRIHDWGQDHPEFRGMGTTVVVLLMHGGNAYIGHVGDSRAYMLRDGQIDQATDDHSLVAQSVREGLITEEQARTHRMRNVITRALGFHREVEVEVQVRATRRGDVFLLCTDGLSGPVQAHDMRDLLMRHGPQEAARQLVGLANARGGDDNITCVVVRVDEVA